MSVSNYQRTLPDIPEQRRQLHRGESLKSRITVMTKILLLQIYYNHGTKTTVI
jgi:hypothetical protein